MKKPCVCRPKRSKQIFKNIDHWPINKTKILKNSFKKS